jgi:hypothetical protein
LWTHLLVHIHPWKVLCWRTQWIYCNWSCFDCKHLL